MAAFQCVSVAAACALAAVACGNGRNRLLIGLESPLLLPPPLLLEHQLVPLGELVTFEAAATMLAVAATIATTIPVATLIAATTAAAHLLLESLPRALCRRLLAHHRP